MTDLLPVCIGVDARQEIAYGVARNSLQRHASKQVAFFPLREKTTKIYFGFERPFKEENGQKIDLADGKPFSTDFAFSRFLVPYAAGFKGWALFCDGDFLFLDDIIQVFDLCNPNYALMCVKHNYQPKESIKMDGQLQTAYPRKNWSSFVLWNCAHPANHFLTPDVIKTAKGSYLHGFEWLEDDQIGAIPEEWNWLEGHSSPEIKPKAVHFTRGGPWLENYQDVAYADLWRSEKALLERPNLPAWPWRAER